LRTSFFQYPLGAVPMPGLPQSLRSQFMLGIAALSLLIVAIGMAGIYALRNGSEAAQRLALQQLEHVQQSQRLTAHARLVERELERLLAASDTRHFERSHDVLVDQVRLLEALLNTQPVADEGLPQASVLDSARQLRASVEHLRALLHAAADDGSTPTAADAMRIAAQRSDVARRSETLVAGTLKHVADHERAYHEALQSLLAHSTGNQRGIVLLLVIALLFTWMVASLFLGRHLLRRLQHVSQHLRSDGAACAPLAELSDGGDEIADMARAVAHLLADREALQRRTAELFEAKESLTEQGRILEMVAARDPLPAVLERLVAMTEQRCPGLRCAVLLPEDADELPPGLQPVQAEPIRSHDGQVLGSFAAYADLARDVSPFEHQSIASAARLAGIAIERQRAEQRIRHMAHHDELTGLPNRALLNDRLGQALAVARRSGRSLGLLFLDLDGFKDINDSLGHPVGDRLLQSVAERLRGLVREGDTVARLGGDEFVVMLVNLAQADDALKIARSIALALARPHAVDEHRLHVTASIGVAAFPDDGDSAAALLQHADVAMYRAKAQGSHAVQGYTRDMSVQARQRVELQGALREAIERGQFELHYQPQLELSTGRLRGVEALIRWHHPQLGLVSPDRFIPLAEETGLIAPLGAWVLHTAGRQLQRWRAAGHTLLTLAVNLSARQVEAPGLPRLVQQVLHECQLPAPCLELEITETALLHNADAVRETLQALKDLGVALALDDFGTGYSSLSHLRRFPIDTIKIDKSFTADIGTSADSAAIIRAIVALARSLGVETVAEGVETAPQLRFLAMLGCHHAQGYHLARPMPAASIDALLALPASAWHGPAAATAAVRVA
jgi:diguanylate cyclase (GGDEF)-like protein